MMSAENVIRSLRVLWRADRILAEIQLRRMAVGLAARLFAGMFAAFGLLMMELASYFALIQITTAIIAAIVLGAFNFLIAFVIVVIAGRGTGGRREYNMAMTLHSSAIETLQLQARSFDTARSSHGLEAILPALIVPAIGLIVKTIRRSASQATARQ
jgi:hypothetical protein